MFHTKGSSTAVVLLAALCLSGLVIPDPALSSPPPAQEGEKKTRKPRTSIINQAYIKIKEHRRKALDKYVRTLQGIIRECAEGGLKETATVLLDRLDAVVKPTRNRRRTQAASGVGLDQQGERVVLGPLLKKAKKNVDTSADGLAGIRRWSAEMREKIAGKSESKGFNLDDLQGGKGKKKGELNGLNLDDLEEEEGKRTSGKKTSAKKTSAKKTTATKRSGKRSTKSKKKKGSESRRLIAKEKRARQTFSKSVEKLAKSCVRQGFPAHAYEILLWALRVDGDNLDLRKIVRQHKYVDKDGAVRWYSPYDMQKVKAGFREHPEFGWVKPSQLKALKAGKVWYKGKWRDRDFVERERQKWENAWMYETEHFSIKTNAPLRDAVEFGREVERLYAFFFRQFVDFYSLGRPDASLVFGGGMQLGSKKLRLNYYRSREHFINNLKNDPLLSQAPGFEVVPFSAGCYWGGNGKAYFFRGPKGPDLSVIYHEVTHQVFGETYHAGPRPPTWLVEGFGVFMEDPVLRGERLLAGTEPPLGIRKKNIRDINDYVKNYQAHNDFHGARRSDNYATAGAVTHFFLFYKGGIYRRGFMRYAREAYRNTGINSPTRISKLYEYLGVGEERLQADWDEFNKNPDLFDF